MAKVDNRHGRIRKNPEAHAMYKDSEGAYPPFDKQYVYLQSLNGPNRWLRNPKLYSKAMGEFNASVSGLLGSINADQTAQFSLLVSELQAISKVLHTKENLLLQSLMAKEFVTDEDGKAVGTLMAYLKAKSEFQSNASHFDIRDESAEHWYHSDERNVKIPEVVTKAAMQAISKMAEEKELISVNSKGILTIKRGKLTKAYANIRKATYDEAIKIITTREKFAAVSKEEEQIILNGIDNMLKAAGLHTSSGAGMQNLLRLVQEYRIYSQAKRKKDGAATLAKIKSSMGGYTSEILSPLDLSRVTGSLDFKAIGGTAKGKGQKRNVTDVKGLVKVSIPIPNIDKYYEIKKNSDYDKLSKGVIKIMEDEIKGTFEIHLSSKDYRKDFAAKPKIYKGYLPNFMKRIQDAGGLPNSLSTDFLYILKNCAKGAIGSGLVSEQLMKALTSLSTTTAFNDFALEYTNKYKSNRIYIFVVSGVYYSFADIIDQMINDLISGTIEKNSVLQETTVRLSDAWSFYLKRKKDPLFENWQNTQQDTANAIYIKTYLRK